MEQKIPPKNGTTFPQKRFGPLGKETSWDPSSRVPHISRHHLSKVFCLVGLVSCDGPVKFGVEIQKGEVMAGDGNTLGVGNFLKHLMC